MQPDLTLEHRVVGDGDETIVLLPGGLTGWQSWEPLLPLLAQRHRVVTIQPFANAAGIAGRTGEADYTTDVEREGVRRTLDAIGSAEKVHLVGWSNGARAALDFALAYPSRVRSVVAVEPAAWWLATTPDARDFADFIAHIAGRELDEDDVVRFLVTAGLGPEGTDFRQHPAWPLWFACRNALSWFGPRALQSAIAGVADLEGLDRPVLCVRGTDTAPWLKSVVDVLIERLPAASLLELPGGHASPLQNPEQFAAAVDSHVAAARNG